MERLSIVLVALLTLSATAWGNDKAKARDAYRSASRHYDLGEFREALADFKEAYRNVEDPALLFNIGQCHRQLGENEAAVRFFESYLNKVANAPNRAAVTEVVQKLEQELREKQAAAAAAPAPAVVASAPHPEVAPPPPTVEPKPAPAPAAVETPPTNAGVVVATPPERKPVYKKWWLWTTVGIVVVAGVGIGLGIGLTRAHTASPVNTDYGTYKPF